MTLAATSDEIATVRPSRKVERRAGMVVAVAACVLVYAQCLAFGADMGLLAGYCALAEMATAILALCLIGPFAAPRFWRYLAVPLGLMAAALAWSVLAQRMGRPLAPDAAGLEQVKLLGVMALITVGALVGRDRKCFEALATWLSVLGLAYVALCLWMSRDAPFTVWGQYKGAHLYRFTGTLMNANAAGCLFDMIALVALGRTIAIVRKVDLRRAGFVDYLRLVLVGCAAPAALATGLLTESRTSFLTAIVLFAAIGVVALRRRDASSPAAKPAVWAAVGLACAGLLVGVGQAASRWRSLDIDAGQRLQAYSHYLALFLQHPMLGFGLGGFRTLNQATLTPSTAPYLWDYGAAHSVVIQSALEGGLPYALLLSLAGLSMVIPVLLTLRSQTPSVLAAGVLAAPLLACVCAMDDIALNIPAIAALSALLLGAGLGAAATNRRHAFNLDFADVE